MRQSEHAGSWYIEDRQERARVREAALPELDAASDEMQRYFMHQVARIHRLTAEVSDARDALKRIASEEPGKPGVSALYAHQAREVARVALERHP